MLESQVEELEIINEDYEEKQLQWNIARYSCNFFSGLIRHLLSLSDVHLHWIGRPNVIRLGDLRETRSISDWC